MTGNYSQEERRNGEATMKKLDKEKKKANGTPKQSKQKNGALC
jgi:hypothetical protein